MQVEKVEIIDFDNKYNVFVQHGGEREWCEVIGNDLPTPYVGSVNFVIAIYFRTLFEDCLVKDSALGFATFKYPLPDFVCGFVVRQVKMDAYWDKAQMQFKKDSKPICQM